MANVRREARDDGGIIKLLLAHAAEKAAHYTCGLEEPLKRDSALSEVKHRTVIKCAARSGAPGPTRERVRLRDRDEKDSSSYGSRPL